MNNKKEVLFDKFEIDIIIKISNIVDSLTCINKEHSSEVSSELHERINNLIATYDDIYKNKIIKPKCKESISVGFTQEEFKIGLENFLQDKNILNLENRVLMAIDVFNKEFMMKNIKQDMLEV